MNFHGFGGLNVPAEEYLATMLNRHVTGATVCCHVCALWPY